MKTQRRARFVSPYLFLWGMLLTLVLGHDAAYAQGSCTKGLQPNGEYFDNCRGAIIPCNPQHANSDTVGVNITMAGNGKVEGKAECGGAAASCAASAWFIENATCSDAKRVRAVGTLSCNIAVSPILGIRPKSYSVTCSVF
jgi:hypothetical protein